MSKLTEEDVKQRFITPALVETAGWRKDQLFMEKVITPGQVIVQGTKTKRGEIGKADYVLLGSKSRKPLAVIEAKDMQHTITAGMQQALGYASKLDAPFAYSSNGKGFIEHDFFTGIEREIGMDEFPTEEALWQRYLVGKGLDKNGAALVAEPYYVDPFNRQEPRYYQQVAIDRTLEAVAHGQRRQLLVMATGTGKTFTAFQIIWRLLKAGNVKRVLYLADRNVLIDQTITGDFEPLSGRITKVKGKQLDSSYEVYMSLYQQLAGEGGEEPFRQFKPEFFDLIIIDECHRGSARDESLWRRVLDYFSSAIHIGVTATPKETKDVSNIDYFGEPIYTYSLKQGIEDGFLAPYKVIRAGLNVDLEGWRPSNGQVDVNDLEVEDREYNVKDYDRNLIIDERTQMIAKYVTSWLEKHGTDSKTIVFCVDIEHAERMRQALANENLERMVEDYRYVMKITGDDKEGKSQLDNFADVNEQYPTVVTTSKLLTTGVNVKTIKLLVLESNIGSMTEFKQIIGRGTRLDAEHGKEFFTIMDFRGSTRHFADPDFDGAPVSIIELPVPEPGDDGEILEPVWPDEDELIDGTEGPDLESAGGTVIICDPPWITDPGEDPEGKVRVRGVEVKLLNERIQYVDPTTGKLVTESIRDFSKKSLLNTYSSLDSFLHAWSAAERKDQLVTQLSSRGVFLEAIRAEANGTLDYIDDFDIILHVAYDKPPLTRRERINHVKKRGYLQKYSSAGEQVLEALLDKYADIGISEIETTRILNNDPFTQFGSPKNIASLFGGRDAYLQVVHELTEALYQAA
ncbi:EcoAI/FtnUII family type I restriction enzme subunit R [Agrococcus casei]|uniref:Type I restriction-modification system, restriction subunit R n=1 Tax=Agrococcus casei LMG 22410 TaxID=1255656 RepID=A0A1R4GKK2_9MICO|nr:DEAD/DEAH box helicase family protein [Agrococcus casei]SJM68634.1 Type I restriction-modification system, restriction subunit R [Agrococcus casei LMG 22410]